MNQFDNNPNFMGINPGMMNSMNPGMMNSMYNNDLNYKINELEKRIKKLEQRIIRLENNKINPNNYAEPDSSLYMI